MKLNFKVQKMCVTCEISNLIMGVPYQIGKIHPRTYISRILRIHVLPYILRIVSGNICFVVFQKNSVL